MARGRGRFRGFNKYRLRRRFSRRSFRKTRFSRRRSKARFGTLGRTKQIGGKQYAFYNGIGLPLRFGSRTRMAATSSVPVAGVGQINYFVQNSCITQPTGLNTMHGIGPDMIMRTYYRKAVCSGVKWHLEIINVGSVGGEYCIFELPYDMPPPDFVLGNWGRFKDIKGAKFGLIGPPGASNNKVFITRKSYPGKMYQGMKYSWTDFADDVPLSGNPQTTVPAFYSKIYLLFLSLQTGADDGVQLLVNSVLSHKITYFTQNPINVD